MLPIISTFFPMEDLSSDMWILVKTIFFNALILTLSVFLSSFTSSSETCVNFFFFLIDCAGHFMESRFEKKQNKKKLEDSLKYVKK